MKKKRISSQRWGSSLRSFPWKDPDRLEKLIVSNELEHYSAKHPEPSEKEIRLVNSIVPSSCPYCGSRDIRKAGSSRDGTQRYSCRGCLRRFSPLTGTVFDSRRIPMSEWIEYLRFLFEMHSVTTGSRDNKNAITTGFYWLGKVFLVLRGSQSGTVLRERVFLDETLFSVVRSKEATKDGKRLRGISRNKICVGVATDGRNTAAFCENVSKPSKKSTLTAFAKCIEPGSVLVHDGDNSHSSLIKALRLTSETHPTSETKGMSDRENPLDPVNGIHSLIKRLMREHGGFRRENIQDWMNLACFILNPPFNVYLKIEKFLRMAVSGHSRLRYRDFYSKKCQK